MNAQQLITLGDVCRIYQPRTITSKQILSEGPYKVFGANGVIGYFDEYNHVSAEVVVTCRGATCGAINITEPNAWITGNAMVVAPKDEMALDKKFLYYYLLASDLSKTVSGAAQPQITRASLFPFPIPLPPLPEQKRVVEILDEADRLRRIRKQADARMRDFLPALFLQMFGDSSNAKNWETKQLSDICELINGRAFKQDEWSVKGLPIIRIQNLNDPKKPFNYFNGELPSKYRVRRGDVLLSWSGTPGTSFGCFRWRGSDAWLNQHIFRVVLNPELIDNEYFIYWLNSRLSTLIVQAHGGVGLRHVTKGELNKLAIPLPPFDLQRKFSAIVTETEQQIEKQKQSALRIEDLFQSLLHECFE